MLMTTCNLLGHSLATSLLGNHFFPSAILGHMITDMVGRASSAASNRLGDVRAARALQRWIRGIVSIQARWRGECVRACQYLRRLASVPADRRVEALAVIRRRVAYRARVASTNSRWTNVRQNRLFNMWQANGNFAQTISGPAS